MMRMQRWRVRARRAVIVMSALCVGIAGLAGYLVTDAMAAAPPPSITITNPTNGGSYRAATWTGAIQGTATDVDGVASVHVALLQHATGRYWTGAGFTSPTLVLNIASGTINWQYAVGAGLPDGQYTASVRATDMTGFTTATPDLKRATFLLDNSVPAAPTLTSAPPSSTRSTIADLAFRSSDRSVVFSCRLDGGPSTSCDGATPRDGLGNITYHDLSIARHCFTVVATDPAGNVSPARSYCWTVTPAAAAINTVGGSPQDTFLDTVYASPLRARVSDASGLPQIGLAVTFTAPSSGPSGRFNSGGCPNTLTCTVITGANGVAEAPPFTANGVAGAFSVNATVVPVASPAVFALTNAARFNITGDLAQPLYPGFDQALELSFTNPNPTSITIAAGTVAIAITVNAPHDAACPVSPIGEPLPNFRVSQTLTAPVTIPANTLSPISLSTLGVSIADWPHIEMVETNTNQDACKNAGLTLNYTAGATG